MTGRLNGCGRAEFDADRILYQSSSERSRKGEIWVRSLLAWAAPCILLAATCALPFAPMGSANFPVSLFIAALKASLVGAIFMRLFEPNPLNRLVAVAGPIWIFVMFLLIGANYFTR